MEQGRQRISEPLPVYSSQLREELFTKVKRLAASPLTNLWRAGFPCHRKGAACLLISPYARTCKWARTSKRTRRRSRKIWTGHIGCFRGSKNVSRKRRERCPAASNKCSRWDAHLCRGLVCSCLTSLRSDWRLWLCTPSLKRSTK